MFSKTLERFIPESLRTPLTAIAVAAAAYLGFLECGEASYSPAHLLTGRVAGRWVAQGASDHDSHEQGAPALELCITEDLGLLDRVPTSLSYESRVFARGEATWGRARAGFQLETRAQSAGVWLTFDEPIEVESVDSAAPFERAFLSMDAYPRTSRDVLRVTPHGASTVRMTRD